MLGVFTSLDLILFFLFWELELLPMYLLISIWGSGRKEYSAMKFVLYTIAGSALDAGRLPGARLQRRAGTRSTWWRWQQSTHQRRAAAADG